MQFFRPGRVISVLMNSMITVHQNTEISIAIKDRLFRYRPHPLWAITLDQFSLVALWRSMNAMRMSVLGHTHICESNLCWPAWSGHACRLILHQGTCAKLDWWKTHDATSNQNDGWASVHCASSDLSNPLWKDLWGPARLPSQRPWFDWGWLDGPFPLSLPSKRPDYHRCGE